MLRDLAHLLRFVVAVARFGFVPLVRYAFGAPIPREDLARRLRRFLDANGLVYRKLGQYLAMRFDLIPSEIAAELDRLFQDADSMPFDEVTRVIARELGRPWHQCFAALDPAPIGSASVAQVHRAMTFDGTCVAVKVQREGIYERFVADTRVMRRIAWLADLFRLTGVLSLQELAQEFADFTGRELDFGYERHAAERLREGMSPYGRVPATYPALSTPRVLTMEFVEGTTFLSICHLNAEGREAEIRRLSPVDLSVVVSRLAAECFRQLFTTGFFHGDPHPGNVILQPDGTFAFLDLGIMGDLPDQHRRDLSGFVQNLALGRFTESAQYYTHLCVVTAETDIDAWIQEVSGALADWYSGLVDAHAPIGQRHMGGLQGRIATAMRRHAVRTRPNQLLVWRALVLLDTTTLRLPIRFDLVESMRSFFEQRDGGFAAALALVSTRAVGETIDLAQAFVPAVRRLAQNDGRPSPDARAIRQRSRRGADGQRTVRRGACALAGAAIGALATSGGGGVGSSIGVATSIVLLALAARR